MVMEEGFIFLTRSYPKPREKQIYCDIRTYLVNAEQAEYGAQVYPREF